MQSFRARVTAVRDLTRDVRQIGLTLVDPPGIRFDAGQFVSFEIDRAGSPFPATRPYSIASSPRERTSIELAFNRVPEGPGSSYLFGLQNGDNTTFKGPVGSFTLRDNERDVLFVATGTGIAPIRSMLRTLADAGSTRRINLYRGLRSERDVVLRGRAGASFETTCRVFHRRRHCRNRARAGAAPSGALSRMSSTGSRASRISTSICAETVR